MGFCLALASCAYTDKDDLALSKFVKEMVKQHQYDEASLTALFNKVKIDDSILKKISKPAESMPWYKYRRIFLKTPRIKAGVQFWNENAKTLAAVERETGVPAAIIVGIIGVETQYGQRTGSYRVIDALSTLAFAYPPRSQFFRGELAHFLLLCRDERLDPLIPTGSYAGAMGIPQFMPSSYRYYAVDFNKDMRRDIWQDNTDVIASIANYFVKHKWQKGLDIASRISAEQTKKLPVRQDSLKEGLRILKLESGNLKKATPLLSTTKAKILAFEQEHGEELWAVSDNFYVITRYNHSPLYAMAVYQLSLAISNLRASSSYEQDSPDPIRAGALQLLH